VASGYDVASSLGAGSADRGEDALKVLVLECVGEEGGPDRFDLSNAGGFNEGLEFLRRDGDVVVGED